MEKKQKPFHREEEKIRLTLWLKRYSFISHNIPHFRGVQPLRFLAAVIPHFLTSSIKIKYVTAFSKWYHTKNSATKLFCYDLLKVVKKL